MISIFRHHLQGRMLRYTIYFVSFIVAFPMIFVSFMKWADPTQGQWAVKVNGTSVSIMQYQARRYEIEQQIERFKRMLGPNAEQLLAMQGLLGDTNKLVINALVTEELFDQVVHAQSLYLSPTFVSQYFLQTMPKELMTPAGTVDAQKLAQIYGQSVEQLEKQTQQRLQQQLILSLAQGAVYVPQFQVKQQYIAQHADRSFTVATFSHASLIANSKAALTEADARAFFESENKKNRRYWEPERRSALVWEFEADRYGVTINEEQIKKYYNRNKYKQFVEQPATIQVRTILLKALDAGKNEKRNQLQGLRAQLVKNPEQFTQKAKELSDDASKKNGGLLPAFGRGTHDPLFEQAAFALAKAGDISPIVETSRGVELLQLVGKNAQTYKPLDKVKDSIVKALRGERFGQFFGFEAKRALAQENKEQALLDFAQRKGGKKREVHLSGTGEKSETYQKKIFGLGKGAGAHSVEGNKGYVVLVTDIAKTYRPAFETVKAQVMRDVSQARAQHILQSLLTQCQRHASLKAFEELARTYGGQLTTTGMINLQNEKQSADLRKQLGKAFEQVVALAVPGSFVAHATADHAYLVRLDSVAAFNEQQFAEHKAELMGRLVETQKRLLEQAFVASLFKNATIKVNEQLVK